MSTPFLVGFARAILADLLSAELIEILPGRAEAVAAFVGDALSGVAFGGTLVHSLAKAFIACPDVVELFADDHELGTVVQDLKSTPAQWVSG